MVERLLESFAALFEASFPRARLERGTALLLAMIVIAGATVRFWGLGEVGLHGDEKTMALPTMHLIESGSPRMPSGMFYPRALGQVYLMAGAVEVFGKSEWALRLPSALCGVLLIVLAWTCGRRFLEPSWNLALAAAVAFLPDFVEDAQTARMYVFLVTSVAAYMTLLFEWERTSRVGYLMAAVGVMLVGLQFHTLAVFAAPLVFVPGLLQGDMRKVRLGALAFAAIAAGFFAIDAWISHMYPQAVAADGGPDTNGPHAALIPHMGLPWLAAGAVSGILLGYFVVRPDRTAADAAGAANRMTAVATLLLACGVVAEVALHYHLAALLIVGGLVLARRVAPLRPGRICLYLAFGVVLALLQALYLYRHGAGSGRQIVGLMLGWPSVWPGLSLAEISPVAGVLAGAAVAWGLWRLAHRQAVPDHLLWLAVGAWLPLLAIGFIRWDIPPRYAEAQIMPLLLGAFAAAQWAARVSFASPSRHGFVRVAGTSPAVGTVAAALACVLVVNPVRAARAIDSGYASHPDHKGAAEFVRAVHPGPRDIVVAEDVLQQTYYLGHVDYWLMSRQIAAPFMYRVDGRWVDIYTNTPLIGTGAELERLIDLPDRGALYIVGSGENWVSRSSGISQALRSPQLKVVYRGRDGLTQVRKADAPQAAAAARGR